MSGHELALATIGTDASVSVRLNPFKTPDAAIPFLEGARKVPWCKYGYILGERPVFTLDPLFHAGAYYVQDSSAMFVGRVFRKALEKYDGEVKVLDLCAAPGGKTTDLAASLREKYGNGFVLVANEVMKQRAGILADNVAVWGDPNVIVTSADPKAFAAMGSYFDIIVADVPCSGEGMFRKDSRAVEEWSEENVRLCAARQRRILGDMWPALREGGTLIYSTCTFEEEENDANLKWAAEELGGSINAPESGFEGVRITECGNMLVPGEVPGEGQWVGSMVKTAESSSGSADISRLHPIRNGVEKGCKKGNDFVPCSDWALSLDFDRTVYPEVPVDRDMALKFLHRDTLLLPDAPLGYLTLTYESLPLGFVKNLGRRCNNLHPQERRIRMNIQ